MPQKPKISHHPRRTAVSLRALQTLQENRPMMAELYRRANARLCELSRNSRSKAGSGDGPQRLLHELEVHQIELELQNAELQKARDELEVALEKYTDLFDFAPVGYVSIDESGLILEANLTSAMFLGMERSQLVNRRLPLFISATDRPVFLAFLKKIFTGSKSPICRAQMLKEGGGTIWTSLRATRAVVLKGARKWCRLAFVDITASKRAEDALRMSEERFRALFESGPVAIYSCDAAGAIQNVNHRAVELWGRKPVLGETGQRFCGSFKMFHRDGRLIPLAQCPMAEVLRGEKGEVRDKEIVIARPDGSRITAIVNIRPLKSEHGKITGAINCFYDVTDRKRAEAAQRRVELLAGSNQKLEQEIVRRQEAEESLKQSEQQLNQSLAQSRLMQEQLRQLSRQVLSAQEEERKRISRELHDVIAQTLTGINLRLATLKKEAGHNPKHFDRNITRTQRLVEHSVNIVHRFARELRPSALDDLGLTPALHTFLKQFTAQTGLHTSLATFAGVEQLDTAARTVLYRVAQEALNNVARHAQASWVKVSVEQLDGGVCMSIKDNGKGFHAERLPGKKINRLGLLGMSERLDMIGGRFTVESNPGKGTTIRAQIPLANQRRSPTNGARQPTALANQRTNSGAEKPAMG